MLSVRLPLNRLLSKIFGESKVTHILLTVQGVSAPNPHIVQESTIFCLELLISMLSFQNKRQWDICMKLISE